MACRNATECVHTRICRTLENRVAAVAVEIEVEGVSNEVRPKVTFPARLGLGRIDRLAAHVRARIVWELELELS